MRLHGLVVGLVATISVGCSESARDPVPLDRAWALSAMDSLWAAYSRAAIAGDADALARFYTDTAHLVEPALPTIRTSSDLRAIAVEFFKAGRYASVEMRPEVTEVAGDRILQAGAYTDVFEPTGAVPQRSFGRFMAVARREPSGSLRISYLIAALDSTIGAASLAK